MQSILCPDGWIQVLLSLDRSLLASASDFGSLRPCMNERGPRHCHFFNVLKSGGCLMNQFANDWDNDSYLGSMDRLVSQKQLDDHYSVLHFLLKLTRGKHNANPQVSTWLGPRSTLDLGTRFEPWVPEFLLFLDDHFIFLIFTKRRSIPAPIHSENHWHRSALGVAMYPGCPGCRGYVRPQQSQLIAGAGWSGQRAFLLSAHPCRWAQIFFSRKGEDGVGECIRYCIDIV